MSFVSTSKATESVFSEIFRMDTQFITDSATHIMSNSRREGKAERNTDRWLCRRVFSIYYVNSLGASGSSKILLAYCDNYILTNLQQLHVQNIPIHTCGLHVDLEIV